jgi:hypothetical protein
VIANIDNSYYIAFAGEDGRGPFTCQDEVDNGEDGLVDSEDPDCRYPEACTNASTDSHLRSHDDWSNISLPFRHFANALDAPLHEITDPLDEPTEAAVSFVRGDCDSDGEVSGVVTDAVFLLNFLFLGGPRPGCLAACDANNDGAVIGVVTDAVYLLTFNFLGGPAPPQPFPLCGPPGGMDLAIGCATSLEAAKCP